MATAGTGLGGVGTGSTLSYPSGTNKTSTAISTNIIIMVGNTSVGAVQSLSIDEKRSIKMIDEVGTDGHIDSVPNQSTNISGSCQRVRFDRMRVAEAFGRAFIHVSSQAYPFDIVIIDKQKLAAASQISTVIKNVWIEGISYQYQANDWVITDNMTWTAETIYSTLNNGNSPAATGGERNIQLNTFLPLINGSTLTIEQQTDTGFAGRRGSLDASGLIDLGSDPNVF
jgi:hypothetical protein